MIVSFIEGVTDTKLDVKSQDKKQLALCSTIENIYKSKNLTLIFPSSFSITLLIYFLTGSKRACELLSKILPCGSYVSILNWMNNQAMGPIVLDDDDVDMFTFLNNNQVMCRTWRVNYNNQSYLA